MDWERKVISIEKRLCIIWAVGAIVIGLLVYVVDRHGQVSFLPRYPIYPQTLSIFGAFGGVLPTLTHTFIFIVISSCVWATTIRHIYITCIFWVVVEFSMEIIQHSNITIYLKSLSLAQGTVGEPLYLFSLYGVFSIGDLIAVIVGAVLAFIVIMKNSKQGGLK